MKSFQNSAGTALIMAIGVAASLTASSYAQTNAFPQNGNAGVGTAAPSEWTGGSRKVLQIKDTTNEAILRLTGSVVDAEWGVNNLRSFIYNRTAQPLAFGTANIERMRISEHGNIGIGTMYPTHLLSVAGTVRAKQVIVETSGWSDYVFEDNYELPALSEVEAHIKTYKHLPGIPSAAQVASEGVSVGDMQAKLLAKIEELTLHQIAQEKELRALRAELARLRSAAR